MRRFVDCCLIVAALGAGYLLSKRVLLDPSTSALAAPASAEALRSTVEAGFNFGSGLDGPLVVVVTDYACPACKRFEETAASDLWLWAEQGRIRLVMVPLPPGVPDAPGNLAARGVICSQDRRSLHDWLFSNRRRWLAQPDALNRIFAERGISTACLNSPDVFQVVTRQIELAENLSITGVPTIFVDSSRLIVRRHPAEVVAYVAEVLTSSELRLSEAVER